MIYFDNSYVNTVRGSARVKTLSLQRYLIILSAETISKCYICLICCHLQTWLEYSHSNYAHLEYMQCIILIIRHPLQCGRPSKLKLFVDIFYSLNGCMINMATKVYPISAFLDFSFFGYQFLQISVFLDLCFSGNHIFWTSYISLL